MRRLILCSAALLSVSMLLAGCENSNSNHSSGYYGGAQAGYGSYHPSSYSSLPDRSESTGNSKVQGFPPGHPLHAGNTYEDESSHMQDEHRSMSDTSSDLGQHQEGRMSLPHNNYNY